jgi:uncharacterized protein YkwD
MKVVIVSLFLLANVCFSQQFKSFSPFRDSTGNITRPIDTRNTYYVDNIDTNKVKQLLYDKFNEFRIDYGVATCIKSTRLHNYAQSWAYDMKRNGLRHSKSIGIWNGENIQSAGTIIYRCLTAVDGDINQLVARDIFDGFLVSYKHMSSLTNTDFKEVGIGITFDMSGHPNQHRIYTVIQLNR